MRHVEIRPLPPERLASLLEPPRAQRFLQQIAAARDLIGNRIVKDDLRTRNARLQRRLQDDAEGRRSEVHVRRFYPDPRA